MVDAHSSEAAMKSGAYSMILNVDGYTSVDGWLNVGDAVLLGADNNYTVTGSIVESTGALDATVSIRPNARLNDDQPRFDLEDATLHGTANAGGFSLRGKYADVEVELRCRFRGA